MSPQNEPCTQHVSGEYYHQGIAPDSGITTGTLTVEVASVEANRNVTFSTSGLNFGYWQRGQTHRNEGVEIPEQWQHLAKPESGAG